MIRQHRAVRRGPVAAALSVSLLLGLLGVAPAQAKDPEGPPAGLKAITALDSKRSALRVAADGSTDGSLGPSAGLGAPADKTLMPADKVLVTKDMTDGSGLRSTTRQAVGLNSTMTALDGVAPPDTPAAVRATIDPQYPSEPGHITNGTTESVLELRSTEVGTDDGLFQLSTSNAVAENWAAGSEPTAPAVGGTFVIQTTEQASIRNAGATTSAAFGTPVDLDTATSTSGLTNPYEEQWAVVDAGDDSVQLISRTDGLCLTAGEQVGAPVTADVCSDDVSRRWKLGSEDADGATTVLRPDSFAGLQTQDDQLVVGEADGFEFHLVPEPGSAAPTWSVPRIAGDTPLPAAVPYDLAVGDLDQVGDASGYYHDEAFVAYTDSADNWAIRVVDYNANASRLLVTGPDASLSFGKNGGTVDGTWYPGNLITEIGDFDGNGTNEVAVAFQGGDGNFYLSFFGYQSTPDGGRELKLLSSCIGCVGPLLSTAPNVGLQVGYVDSAVGDFDGDGRDDLAIGFGNVTVTPYDRDTMVPNLAVVTFQADLSLRSQEVTTPPLTNGVLPPPLAEDPTSTHSGIQVEAGLFHNDPENGYGGQRDEIAIAWVAQDFDTADDGVKEFELTPQFQLYRVDDANDACQDGGPGCETTTTPLGADARPTSLFPAQPTTDSRASDPSQTYDVPPLTFEAGRYGGIDPTDPPLSGLMTSFYAAPWGPGSVRSQVWTSIVVPWVTGDSTGQKWTITDTKELGTPCPTPCSRQTGAHRFTAYDRLGQSVVLGAPVVMNVEGQIKQDLLAAQPPAHVDWLDGSFTNVSANENFSLSTSKANGESWSSTATQENTHSYDVSESLKVSETLTAGFGPLAAKSSASVKLASKQAWSGVDTTSTAENSSANLIVSAKAALDDSVSISEHNYQVWRYPIIGGPGAVSAADCGRASPCATYYEVTIPGDTKVHHNIDGTSNELFSPSWQNNNALSYPVLQDDEVPLPDLGTYVSSTKPTNGDGNGTTVDTALVNTPSTVGTNAKSWELDITNGDTEATSRSSTFGWSASAEVDVNAKLSVGLPVVGGSTTSVEATAGFDAAGTMMSATTGSSTSSTGQSYALNVPAVDGDQGYEVGSAYYYDKAGTPKIVHGVDLVDDDAASFWKQTYGEVPDPALNLPNTIVIIKDSDDVIRIPYFRGGYARQELRGFEVLQVDSDALLPTAGVPFATNPAPGQRMQFQTQVHNLSLADMPGTVTAHFYAVPVDSDGAKVTGPKIDLGESVEPVPALKAQGTGVVVSQPWTAPSVGTASQKYRIFVQLNADGAPGSELHPLTGGDACPSSSIDPTYTPPQGGSKDYLADLMSTEAGAAEPLACGQNNQGYGTVTVMAPAPTSTDGTGVGAPARRANVQLAGAGLFTDDPADLHLDENSSVPTVHVDQEVTGLVHAMSDTNSADIQTVAVYDGKPEDGHEVYVGRLAGSSAEAGGHAKFRWTPRTPGLHELHHVVFGTDAAGEDDEQILRVWVDNEPAVQPFTVTASADAPTVDVGKPVTIRGRVTPVPSNPSDRGVQLQVQGKVGWTDVAETDLADDGTYSFTIPETKRGTYSYRVKKFATATSSTGFSPPVSVEVARSFRVSVKASPATVDTGSSVTIKGTVAPKVKAGHRVVDLQVKTGSDWRRVASKKTRANGSYSFRVKQPTAGTFEYRVEKRAVGSRRTTASPTVTVTVLERYAVTAEAERPKLPKGASTKITGTVTPAGDGPVQLQRRKGSTWRKVGTQSTDASGGFSFPVEAVKTGTFTYRVKKTASDGRRAAYSPSVKVKVTKKAG